MDRRRIPNLLSGGRLIALPILWGVALAGQSVWLGGLLVVVWLTDILDGYLARRWNAESELGSRLDTIGDHLVLFSMMAWVVLLEPGFIQAEGGLIILWLGLWLGALAFGWVKFRRFANLHLYSSKAAVLLAVVFMIHLFLVDGYSQLFFYVAAAVGVASSLEMLAVMMRRQEVDEHVGTILRDLRA